ncbi:hypothetical protein ES707_15314 [subsurface metagenome]
MDRIMQLPDCAFGRRWLITVLAGTAIPGGVIAVSRGSVPERAVLWEIHASISRDTSVTPICSWRWTLFFTDDPNIAEPTVREQEPLFPGNGVLMVGQYWYFGDLHLVNLRWPYKPSARLLGADLYLSVGDNCVMQVVTVWSSIPKEVPDWMCSAIR